jgi:hypothetical protein
MKDPFEKIRLIGLDIDLTQPSQEGPGFRRLSLKLSKGPPPEWVKIFEQARRFPTRRIWRNAWIVGAHMVVECVPEELGQFQLNRLKEDVEETNKKFSEWITRSNAQTLRHRLEQAELRMQLEKLRAKLKFD